MIRPRWVWLAISVAFFGFVSAASSRLMPDTGKPAAGPLPTYCQMDECWVSTVEATDPIAFGSNAVLFRVEEQNWRSTQGDTKHLKRQADSTAYVLCSKTTPAVISEYEGVFLVTFLVPNERDGYYHANETSLAEYFVVCHSRAFGSALDDQGPAFAQSVGYTAKARGDQPKIDKPERIFDLVK
jgi:hypothetical protein